MKQKIENHVTSSGSSSNNGDSTKESLQQPCLFLGESERVKYMTSAFEMR